MYSNLQKDKSKIKSTPKVRASSLSVFLGVGMCTVYTACLVGVVWIRYGLKPIIGIPWHTYEPTSRMGWDSSFFKGSFQKKKKLGRKLTMSQNEGPQTNKFVGGLWGSFPISNVVLEARQFILPFFVGSPTNPRITSRFYLAVEPFQQ